MKSKKPSSSSSTAAAYRYPGVKPFSQEDSHLFFGRTEDISSLVRYLRTEDLVVLHGKSGLGKTSLIQAGVIPMLAEGHNKELPFEPITFRFNSFNPRNPQNLLNIAEQNIERESTFLDSLPVKYISLWQALRSRQLQDGAPEVAKEYLLIFDQFEELFSYPDDEVDAFAHDLADLYNCVVPAEFKKVIRREEVVNDELSKTLEQPGMREWLNGKLKVKILIAIRSDKFNLLDRLTQYIPDVMLNSRLLEALRREQAEEAIVLPAAMEKDFESPTFGYSDEAKDRILDFLTSGNTRRVEGFQLQILCRNIEENLIGFANSAKKGGKGKIQFSKIKDGPAPFLVKSISEDFGDILRNYYDEQIDKLEPGEEQEIARLFIEDELIADGRRVSMDRAAIKAEVSDELLYKLVNARLIRREPNSMGGYSFEISHDTLLEPILGARRERKLLEQEEDKRREEREAEIRRQKQIEAEREEQEKELAKARAEKAELEKQRALEAQKAERRNKYFLLTLLILVLIIAAITTLSLLQVRSQNKSLEMARDTLQQQGDILQRELGVNKQSLDSILALNQSLPTSERKALNRTANYNRMLQQVNDSLTDGEGKAFLRLDELVIRTDVSFPPSNLVPEADKSKLIRIASVLADFPEYMIDIQVHTDRFGSARNNALLSSNRAEQILEVMAPVIDPGNEESSDRVGRITISGMGESMPISQTDREANRRVDIVICERKETK